MYQNINSIDLTDLVRGEGDWRNMQDIIRRTFRTCIETQQRQEEKIAQLTNQLTKMQDVVHRKPSWEDIERLVETRLMSQANRKVSTGSPQTDELRLEISQLRASLEHKVNIRALDSMLAKKVDRSDILVKNLTDLSASSVQRDLKVLKEEVLDLKSKVSIVENEIDNENKGLDQGQVTRDMVMVRAQVENIYKTLHDYHTKDHLKHLLDQKVSHNDLPALLSSKANDEEVHKSLHSVEETLARHEKLLTSLRLSANDATLFREDVKKPSKGSKHSGLNMSFESKSDKRKEFEELMREGRLEAIMSKFYTQMTNLSAECESLSKLLESLEKNQVECQEKVNLCANKQAVELLAVVVEEQRLRTDSIIQGSVKIKPIYKDLKRLQNELEQIQAYVQVPQSKSLQITLQDIQGQLQEAKSGLYKVQSVVQEQCISPIATLNSRLELGETVWQAYEADRDRLQYVLQVIDFSDTPYNNLKELSRSIVQLYFMVQGDPLLNQLQDKSILELSSSSVMHRLSELEHDQNKLHSALLACQHALLVLKSLLAEEGRGSSGEGFASNSSSSAFHSSMRGEEKGSHEEESKERRKPTDIVNQVLHSLEEMMKEDQAQNKHAASASSSSSSAPGEVSFTDIDERLQKLQKQKQQLRKKLLAEVDIPSL